MSKLRYPGKFYFGAECTGRVERDYDFHGRFGHADAPLGRWTHLAMVIQPNRTFTAYVDGVEQFTADRMSVQRGTSAR